MNNVLACMRKEVVVAYFKVISQHLCVRTDKKTCQDSQLPGQDSRLTPVSNTKPLMNVSIA